MSHLDQGFSKILQPKIANLNSWRWFILLLIKAKLMKRSFRSLTPLAQNLTRSLSSTNNCITDLPPNLKTKALIYSSKEGQFVALGKDNKIAAYRTSSSLLESQEDFVKAYTKHTKEPNFDNKIFSANFPSIEEICQGFDEDSWLEFMKKLHPSAVSILKIDEKNRKNIRSYNHAIPSSGLALQGDEYDCAVRNFSKAIHFLPFLEKIINGNPEGGKKLLDSFLPSSELDPAKSLIDYLKTPHAKRSFFKRVGDMHPHLIKEFHDLIFNGIVDENGVVDKKLYGERISVIPIPNKLDEERHNSLKRFVDFCFTNGFFTKKAKQEMFDEVIKNDGDWVKNTEVVLSKNFKSLMDEYLSSMALNLILPTYIEKFNEKADISLDKSCQHFPDKYDHWSTKYVLKEITTFLQDAMIRGMPEQIYEYAKEYDNKASGINNSKPLFVKRMEELGEGKQLESGWFKAFENCEINGVQFRCLVNEKELKEEADYLHHCAAGYGPRCRDGIRHIVSGTASETGERFTLRFSSGGGKIVFDEAVTIINNGKRDILSKEAEGAIKTLLEKIKSQEIKLSPVFGSLNKDFTISDTAGFDITNKDEHAALFQAYNSLSLIPIKTKSLEDFNREIGLEDFLNKTIESHIKLNLRSLTPPSSIGNAIADNLHKGPREGGGILDA